MNQLNKNLLRAILAVVILLSLYFVVTKKITSPTVPVDNTTGQNSNTVVNAATNVSAKTPSKSNIFEPISNALNRITKKPFGIYITKQNSPVQPERFSGYHTGVDFETTPEEQNIDVSIAAICSGKLVMKKYATGYGGVAVEACQIDGADVTVIYGHLKLSSIQSSTGQPLKEGEDFAVLGKGYSSETDGERKHLHLGIHKGASINILGYAQKQADLTGWIDAEKYLVK